VLQGHQHCYERSAAQVRRCPAGLHPGPAAVQWDGHSTRSTLSCGLAPGPGCDPSSPTLFVPLRVLLQFNGTVIQRSDAFGTYKDPGAPIYVVQVGKG
jgi:hypothetical protein